MRIIQLTQGMEALVSDEDFEWACQWTWYAHQMNSAFYAARTYGGPKCNEIRVFMHDAIAKRMGLIGKIDHEDRNSLNNQRSNLRAATKSQNMANRNLPSSNRTGYRGVSFDPKLEKFRCQIRVRGTAIHLGLYKSPEEAARAYDRAAKIYFGEFAFLNFPEEKT